MNTPTFPANPKALIDANRNGRTLHVLCLDGELTLTVNTQTLTLTRGGYALILGDMLLREAQASSDCRFESLAHACDIATSDIFSSTEEIPALLRLLQHPTVHLDEGEPARMAQKMAALRSEVEDSGRRFHTQCVECLVKGYFYYVLGAFAADAKQNNLEGSKGVKLAGFIRILLEGTSCTERSLNYYATMLNITPHYLSEVCRELSGESAQYWIDRFTVFEAVRKLRQGWSIIDIVTFLNFSSQSYFTRYISKHLGVTPSYFR